MDGGESEAGGCTYIYNHSDPRHTGQCQPAHGSLTMSLPQQPNSHTHKTPQWPNVCTQRRKPTDPNLPTQTNPTQGRHAYRSSLTVSTAKCRRGIQNSRSSASVKTPGALCICDVGVGICVVVVIGVARQAQQSSSRHTHVHTQTHTHLLPALKIPLHMDVHTRFTHALARHSSCIRRVLLRHKHDVQIRPPGPRGHARLRLRPREGGEEAVAAAGRDEDEEDNLGPCFGQVKVVNVCVCPGSSVS